MKRADILIYEILAPSMDEPEKYRDEPLVKQIINQGWHGVDPIPVIKLPKQEQQSSQRFQLLPGGEERLAAAILTNRTIANCYVSEDK